MQFKLFVVALLGTTVLQVAFAFPASQDIVPNRGLINNLISKVEEDIDKLSDLIKQKVNEALNTLNILKHKVSEQVSQAIAAVKQQLTAIIARARESIKTIIDKARDLAVDITECVSENEERLQQVFESVLADEISCVTNELKKALTIINESVTVIQNSLSSITSLPKKLSKCNNLIPCVIDVLAEVSKLQLQLPVAIVKSVADATEFITGLQTRLEICATTQVIKAEVATVKIIIDVTKCAFDHGIELIK